MPLYTVVHHNCVEYMQLLFRHIYDHMRSYSVQWQNNQAYVALERFAHQAHAANNGVLPPLYPPHVIMVQDSPPPGCVHHVLNVVNAAPAPVNTAPAPPASPKF